MQLDLYLVRELKSISKLVVKKMPSHKNTQLVVGSDSKANLPILGIWFLDSLLMQEEIT